MTMRGETRQVLQGTLDHVASAFAACLQDLAAPLAAALQERSVSEPSAERRKFLVALKLRVDSVWRDLVEAFDDSFRRNAAIRAGWASEDDRDLTQRPSSLSLLGDEQVEWDLALAGALSRMKGAGGEPLSEYEQRVNGVLATSRDGGETGNPLSIDVAGIALKAAIEKSLSDTAEQRALLIYVEPLLSKQMPALFAAANEYLAGRGVEVPRLKPQSGAARTAASRANGGDDAVSSNVLNMLQQLVMKTGGTGGGGGGGGAGGNSGSGPGAGFASDGAPATGFGIGPGMVAVPAAMLESFERLQANAMQNLQADGASGSAVGGNVLRELRDQEFAKNLPPIDAATIDIVAMLFDFIFDDKLVPDTVKALVGRLQIPLLKLAMLDKRFFSDRSHPARLLLDTISKVSIAAGKDLHAGHPVFERIRAAVGRVLAEFENDKTVFAGVLPDMQALLAEQEALALENAEKAKSVAEMQEVGEIAESRADEAFSHVLEQSLGDATPPHIRDFLTRHWTRVLKLAFIKGGIKGHPWALAIQTLTDLLWSLQPKDGADERQRLIRLLPELLRRVNAYLDRVGVKPEEKAPFLDALVEIHSVAIKGTRRPARHKHRDGEAAVAESKQAPVAEPLPAGALVSSNTLAPSVVVTRTMQDNGIEVESMALSGKVMSSRSVRTPEVSGIQRNDWVEFTEEDGTTLRGRLTWVSPQRGIMLFTNPQSKRAISISPEALALQIRRGLARRLVEADEPLVDRALGKAMDSLQAA